ncbi:MAG TPA: adenylate/guanylate cyclase domain-containing protein [Burkholderiales bacterium]|nr:adenylate/guanylate cyclase domain-containing protein [Burkholderiales bacterium]
MAEEGLKHRLTAILAADVAGYSRLMSMDERATVAALDAARAVFRKQIEANQGRIIDMAGDSVLAVFDTAAGAVTAALGVQAALLNSAAAMPEDRRMRFRIGVHLGDVIEKTDGTVYGDGVNIAARLEGLAEPGGVTVSESIRTAVKGRVGAAFEDQGSQQVKNIADPVRAYRVGPESSAAPKAAAAAGAATRLAPDKPSIAVLPFTNMSGDPEQEYFADGITEDIITDISKISGLFVIARNSSFVFKNRSIDVKEVGGKLGVRHVLEGSVRKVGMKVRINVQLINAETGGHVWAERYDRGLEDILAVQDEVTRRIVGALEVNLTSSELVRREDLGKVNPQAYDYLIRGRSCILQFTAEALVEGRAMLERALAIDAGLAPAYASLAILHCTEYVNGWNNPGADHLERALELAGKACEVNQFEPASHFARAIALMWLRQLDDAERAAQRAIELDPNRAEAYGCRGNVLDFAGQHENAIRLFERALRLDPQFDLWIHACGRAQFALERFDEAEASFKRRLIRMPRSDVTRAYLAALYGHTGRHEEARQMWRELMAINPKYSLEHVRRVMPYKSPATLDRLVDGLRKAGLGN